MSNNYGAVVTLLPLHNDNDPMIRVSAIKELKFDNIMADDASGLMEQMTEAKYDSVSIRYLKDCPTRFQVDIIPKKLIAFLKINPQ